MSQALQADTPVCITLGREYYHLQYEIFDWCEERFGHGGWRGTGPRPWENLWEFDGAFGTTHFYFKQPEHAMMFKLRWYRTVKNQ